MAAANPSYASLDGVLFNKEITTLILFPGGLVSYVIPSSVISIGEDAFYGCTGLTEVVIPNSVTTISEWAFSGCSGLMKVVIGSGVTNTGQDAFENCSSLQEVYFKGNAPTVVGGDGFSGISGKKGTVYYLDGTTGWGDTFFGWPTVLYEPATLE